MPVETWIQIQFSRSVRPTSPRRIAVSMNDVSERIADLLRRAINRNELPVAEQPISIHRLIRPIKILERRPSDHPAFARPRKQGRERPAAHAAVPMEALSAHRSLLLLAKCSVSRRFCSLRQRGRDTFVPLG